MNTKTKTNTLGQYSVPSLKLVLLAALLAGVVLNVPANLTRINTGISQVSSSTPGLVA